jgi:dihydroorotate dehydrogenase (fumarate)
MADLACTFLGINLKNPIIVGSSGLANSVEKIKILEENGAGAVVLKPIFEEEIDFEAGRIIDLQPTAPEAIAYQQFFTHRHTPQNYLKLIEESKKEVDIPIFASINCIGTGEWVNFTKSIESSGADALELNVFFFPDDKDFKADDYERTLFDIAAKVAYSVKIPVFVKLVPYFTNLLYIVDQFFYRGIRGVVLFNQGFQPDLNIENLELIPSNSFNIPSDEFQVLRWTNIIASNFNNIEIASATNISDSNSAIKLLLVGASTIMLSSTLYAKGIGYIKILNEEILLWMKKSGFEKIEQFQGQVNYNTVQDPFLYERSQFMRSFN